MEYIQRIPNIDLKQLTISLLIVLFAVQAIVKLFQWFVFEWLGIETHSMREKREEHELLITTATELKNLSQKHETDIETLSKHDAKIENAIQSVSQEVRETFAENSEKFNSFYENREIDRKQSLEIQEQLSKSIEVLAETDKYRNVQIESLMKGTKELLGDKIDQKYEKYVNLGGIPSDELDEFNSIFDAYTGLNGNHSREKKYDYVMNNLQIIPVTTLYKRE